MAAGCQREKFNTQMILNVIPVEGASSLIQDEMIKKFLLAALA